MLKCNNLIFVGFARNTLAPQNFCIICYNFTLWEGLFFGGPWVRARAKKMQDFQFQNVGYSCSVTQPWKHKFDSKQMAIISHHMKKVLWRLLRFIQGHKWHPFTLQHTSVTRSGMKFRVYRKWYIRVSVNPSVNPCDPPLVFGKHRSKASCKREVIYCPRILTFFNVFNWLLV